jgi:ABC-type dipeptide/oligopeptide/nickel transport system permease component
VFWLNLGLAVALASGLLVLCCSRWARPWTYGRVVVRFGFQLSGVLAVTWLVITMAANARAATGGVRFPATSATAIEHQVLALVGPSVLLLFIAATIGSTVGLAAAYVITLVRVRRLSLLGVFSTLILAIPTFLLAATIQEAQARLNVLFGQNFTGGYATVSAAAIFWAGLVLGLRPAAYVFRYARLTLDLAELENHVRAARARGLKWSTIARRHVLRPVMPGLITGSMNSLRLMIGSLPLIEFFFGYPGLGQQLIFALGIGYQGQRPLQPDLAAALVMALAILLLGIEAFMALVQQLLDPRLHELRMEVA